MPPKVQKKSSYKDKFKLHLKRLKQNAVNKTTKKIKQITKPLITTITKMALSLIWNDLNK